MSLYLPAHFTVADGVLADRHASALIAANPFATLISSRDSEPFVTHCPITLQTDPDNPAGPLFLEGHVARANPHWQDWAAGGDRVLAIFHGPQAYVSPTLYANHENVPTWNYVVVHARGRIALVPDSMEHKDALLKRLIAHVEPTYAEHWRALSPQYQQRMLDAIVGFRIHVERFDAKFKVSQNRAPVDRQRVHDAFAQADAARQSLAAWMRTLGAI